MFSQKGLCDPVATYSSHFVQKIQLLATQFDFACSECEMKKDSGLLGSAEQVCAFLDRRLCHSVAEVPKRGTGALPGVGAAILDRSLAV